MLAAVVTSNGATGSYNSMHDSYQPVGVLVPLVNMLLGEVIFGGLGTGLYSMVMIALVAVFLGGPDDRPHARVSRKENHRRRDQADHFIRAADASGGAGVDRYSAPHPLPARLD